MAYSPNEDLNEKYRELCQAIGHLFISFGRLEGTLSATLRLHLANNFADHLNQQESVGLSSAIYGSMRFKTARDTLRRLAKAEGVSPEVDTFLDSVFSHIGNVEALRDKLAHQVVIAAADPALGGYWQVSDQVVTRDIKNVQIFVFDTEAVLAGARDLVAAAHRLGGQIQRIKLFEQPAFDLSPIAWQYKPAMLKRVRLGTARTRG
jgi:hypothetical protein